MRKSRRLIWWAVIGVAVVGATVAIAWPDAEPVDVALAERTTMRVTVSAEARTRARDRFVVVAPVTGRLERMRLRPGDRVRLGEVVASISPMPLDAASAEAARSRVSAAEAAKNDAESRVRQLRAASDLAQRAVERFRAVEAAGGVSPQQREDAELAALTRAEELRTAEAHGRAAAAELFATRAALPYHSEAGYARSVQVLAPSAGRVLTVPESSERIVSAGTLICELGRDADIEIVADVLSDDAVRIPSNAPVELVGWGGDVVLRGLVARIDPAAQTRISALGVDEQRVNVIITPESVPRELGDGYRLDARITIWERPGVLVVPPSAVFRVGNSERVFVVADGRAREATVRVGQRSDSAVEILAGLAQDDVVIVFPSDRIRTGARVKASRIETTAGDL